MLIFITRNQMDWTGVFYAVDEFDLVDIEDKTDPTFTGRGILTDDDPIIISTNRLEPTHYMCRDAEMVSLFQKVVDMYESGQVPVTSMYGNVISLTPSDVPWAMYRIHIAYDNE